MVVCVQRVIYVIYESWYIVESLYGAEYGNWRLAADILTYEVREIRLVQGGS